MYQNAKKTALVAAKKKILTDIQASDIEQIHNQFNVSQQEVSYEELIETLTLKLRHDDMVPMSNPACSYLWLETFLAVSLINSISTVGVDRLSPPFFLLFCVCVFVVCLYLASCAG